MAQALSSSSSSSSFDDWIRSLLGNLQSGDVDMSDFVQYLMGIVASDSETVEEKRTAIAELLNDLDLKHQHDIENLSSQILDQWHASQNGVCANGEKNPVVDSIAVTRVADKKDDDAISMALINAMNHIESTAKQNKSLANGAHNKPDDDAAFKRNRSQMLAKYSEVSDEELDYGDNQSGAATSNASSDTASGLFRNTNAQDVEDRERKVRDSQQETSKNQKEKNKLDANNQKQKDEERKKKAQQRAQKQERRR